MPELDGFGLAMALRQDPGLRNVPLVLVTSSYVESSDRTLARRAGANDLVLRTPDLAALIDVLRDTLDRGPLRPDRAVAGAVARARARAQSPGVPPARAPGHAQHRSREAVQLARVGARRAHRHRRGRAAQPRCRCRARRGDRELLRRGRRVVRRALPGRRQRDPRALRSARRPRRSARSTRSSIAKRCSTRSSTRTPRCT